MTLADIAAGNVPVELRPAFEDLKGKSARTIRRRLRDLEQEGALVVNQAPSTGPMGS